MHSTTLSCIASAATLAPWHRGLDIVSYLLHKRVDEADKEAIAAYLSSYDKTIPPDMLPRLPSVQTIAKKLQEPRNSGVGPDGMPFAFYRNLSDLLAPIFFFFFIIGNFSKFEPLSYRDHLLHVVVTSQGGGV
jgi:hypothetical protein